MIIIGCVVHTWQNIVVLMMDAILSGLSPAFVLVSYLGLLC